MTVHEAGDRVTRAIEGWAGRLLLAILMSISGVLTFNVLQSIQQTQESVSANGRTQTIVQTRLDTLNNTVGQIQGLMQGQRTIDDRHAQDISEVRTDLRELKQEFHDHEEKDMKELQEHIEKDMDARTRVRAPRAN